MIRSCDFRRLNPSKDKRADIVCHVRYVRVSVRSHLKAFPWALACCKGQLPLHLSNHLCFILKHLHFAGCMLTFFSSTVQSCHFLHIMSNNFINSSGSCFLVHPQSYQRTSPASCEFETSCVSCPLMMLHPLSDRKTVGQKAKQLFCQRLSNLDKGIFTTGF